MAHPFENKLCVFIGTPGRCTRQAARDALVEAGGVPDERIGVWTDCVIAFGGAERMKVYEKAAEYDRWGRLNLLDENQFFDILEGKADMPPRKKPERDGSVIISYATKENEEASAREMAEAKAYMVNKKRMEHMRRRGVPTEDGGRAKADLRPFDLAKRFSEYMESKQITSGMTATINMTVEKNIRPALSAAGV